MDLYQHDSGGIFRFVVLGALAGPAVKELDRAWTTAASVLRNRELVVDVSRLSRADAAGYELLSRMRESGARLIASVKQR